MKPHHKAFKRPFKTNEILSSLSLSRTRLSQLCRQNGRSRVHQNKDSSRFDQQAKYSTFSATNHGGSSDGIKNYNRKEWVENSYQYLDSVWSRLKVIQVSKNLLQKEVSTKTSCLSAVPPAPPSLSTPLALRERRKNSFDNNFPDAFLKIIFDLSISGR